MAASDQMFRDQKTLDVVFGVSSLLMLFSVIWMFAQDFFRDYKVEGRVFRDVEEAMAQREMLRLAPDESTLAEIAQVEKELAEALKARNAVVAQVERETARLLTDKVRGERAAQATKADYDSIVSLYNIEIDKRNAATPGSYEFKHAAERAETYLKQQLALKETLDKQQLAVERIEQEIWKKNDQAKAAIDEATAKEDRYKKLTADFDRFAKLASQKRWTWGDTIRGLPILDAFASPTRINQYALDDLPIDYNFKRVTRYDRCTTCHLGLQNKNYTPEALRDLTDAKATAALNEKIQVAQKVLNGRKSNLSMLESVVDLSVLNVKTLPPAKLTETRIKQFAAHPRLDLFVSETSPHPAQDFGCTICHSGQGSATDFVLASHSPNDALQQKQWKKTKNWESNHYWDFPMLPKRFVESSCLKCHHHVADLLPRGNQIEMRAGEPHDTPGAKVTWGYELVRDNGCFGCHEISGIKGGRWVGPDLRLEPSVPVEELPPDERAKLLADPLNPPGSMRKVGPSLRRLVEKTNEEWVRKWIYDPRGFRPDTKMPHFYNLANNSAEALKGTGQEGFPEAEVHAIAFYLMAKSKAYLAEIETLSKESSEATQAREARIAELKSKAFLSAEEKTELAELGRTARLRKTPGPIGAVKLPDDYKENLERGRELFTSKGCLACHAHEAVETSQGKFAAVKSEAHFGPNLTRVAAKLGAKPGDPSAKRWLIQWIKNPMVHSPRTYMPVTHLDDDQAADIAAWLLAQPADPQTADVPMPEGDVLKNLARAYLIRQKTQLEVNTLFAEFNADKLQETLDDVLPAEDRALAKPLGIDEKLKLYVGQRAINQLGCFGCHDIPGYENAKPIGTPLNDWGKKDPERLAFEDITAYVKAHFHVTPTAVDEKGFGFADKEVDGKVKPPVEQFYVEALEHGTREGFLQQKLRDPRSYDHSRRRDWDERLRMPQFRFARGNFTPRKKGEEVESDEQARNRAEAEAREAVMTFVLGLVAEPVPPKYVHHPSADKLAEIKGKVVLDKFNCGGCHQLREGIFEVKVTPTLLEQLDKDYENTITASSYKSDHFGPERPLFPGHNAWTGTPSPDPSRLTIHGLPMPKAEDDDAPDRGYKLVQALRYQPKEGGPRNFPAGADVYIPNANVTLGVEPRGGAFIDVISPWLVKLNSTNWKDDATARASLPPPLMREGEKTQPGWLFQFLRNPYPLRPIVVLRMPRFNLSDADAQALVDYFAAVDRLSNPGIGLNAPYLTVTQRDQGYLIERNRDYLAHLEKVKGKQGLEERAKLWRPAWEVDLKDRLNQVAQELRLAEAAVERASKPDDKKAAEALRDKLKSQLDALAEEAKQTDKMGPYLTTLRETWERESVYATDAWRLLADRNSCISCHPLGRIAPSNNVGPSLVYAPERLRPDWTQRWIANPQRLLIYKSGLNPMPQFFSLEKPDKATLEMFPGSVLDHSGAIRDVLMNFHQVLNLPENRIATPAPPAGGN